MDSYTKVYQYLISERKSTIPLAYDCSPEKLKLFFKQKWIYSRIAEEL